VSKGNYRFVTVIAEEAVAGVVVVNGVVVLESFSFVVGIVIIFSRTARSQRRRGRPAFKRRPGKDVKVVMMSAARIAVVVLVVGSLFRRRVFCRMIAFVHLASTVPMRQVQLQQQIVDVRNKFSASHGC